MQAKSSKTTILDFMRSSSYAPQTAEALIETIPISGNLDHFWKDMLELEENGEIIKTRFGPTACLKKWACSLADSS